MTAILSLLLSLQVGTVDARPLPPPRDPLPPVPSVPLLFRNDGQVGANTWRGLEEEDLLARMMLSEQSYKVLDPDLFPDVLGVAFVAANRLDPDRGYLSPEHAGTEEALWRVLAFGQFHGLTGGNAYWAADPESYPHAFLIGDRLAGRRAYWRARLWADLVLDGQIPDPTGGATMFSDAYADGTPRLRTAFWRPGEQHLTLESLEATAQ